MPQGSTLPQGLQNSGLHHGLAHSFYSPIAVRSSHERHQSIETFNEMHDRSEDSALQLPVLHRNGNDIPGGKYTPFVEDAFPNEPDGLAETYFQSLLKG